MHTLQDMTDEDLFQWMDMAERDCKEASEMDPNSEWHEQCFAALLTMCLEAQRRGIKRHQLH